MARVFHGTEIVDHWPLHCVPAPDSPSNMARMWRSGWPTRPG